jgi:ATP-dependent DNA helicase RecQ
LAAHNVEAATEARREALGALSSALGPEKSPRGAGIVYAATRRQTEQWAEMLRGRGWNAAPYHAGLPAPERSEVASRFAERTLDVVVATNAFGMGIDRPDIRAVVHVQPPSSIEAYYQEVGRAGRDGAEAWGLLLCSGADISLRRRLVTTSADGSPTPPELAARGWALFRELLRYLDARTCRHDFILRYFGDEQELLGGCGHCDVCLALDNRDDGGPADANGDADQTARMVRIALSAVARARQRAGLVAVAEMVRGVDSERTRRFGFTELSTFGLLRDRTHPWVMDLLRALLAAGWIDLTPTEHPVPFVTRTGGEVMRGQGPVRFVLPAERDRSRPRGRASPGRAPGRGEPPAADALGPADRDRFERLRAHRASVARSRGVPAYVVALDRTLIEMAMRAPRSHAELLELFGMGPARVEQYGDGFLEALRGPGS